MLLRKIEQIYNNLIQMAFELDSRIFALVALCCIAFCPIFIAMGLDSYAEQSATYAYFALIFVVVIDFSKALFNKVSKYFNLENSRFNIIKSKAASYFYKKYILGIYNFKNKAKSQKDSTSKNRILSSINFNFLSVKKSIFEVINYKYFIIIYVLLMIVYPWITSSGYLFFIDYVSGPNAHWISYDQPFAPIQNLFILIGYILGQSIAQKLFVSLVLGFVLYSGYMLGGTAVAIAAVFNPFVYDRLAYGQINVILGYAFLILIMSKFNDNFLEKRLKMTSQKALYFGVMYGFSVLASPHYIFISGLLIAGLFLFIYEWPKKGVIPFLYASISFIVINSVWLYNNLFKSGEVSNFVNKSITSLDFEIFQTVGTGFISRAINNIQLIGFWGSETGRYLSVSSHSLYFWPFIFIFIGVGYGLLTLYKESPFIAKFFMYISVLTLFLAQGTSILFLKTFLYQLPFYNGLREPEKWLALLLVIYLFLVTIFIKTEKRYRADYVLAIASIAWVPYILFGVWGQVKSIQYPKYWNTINSELVNNHCYKTSDTDTNSKILILPWHMYVSTSWTQKVSANPAAYYFDCQNIITGSNMELGGVYDNSNSIIGNQVSNWVSSQGTSTLPSDIQSILLFKEVDWVDYKFITGFNKATETENYILYTKS